MSVVLCCSRYKDTYFLRFSYTLGGNSFVKYGFILLSPLGKFGSMKSGFFDEFCQFLSIPLSINFAFQICRFKKN